MDAEPEEVPAFALLTRSGSTTSAIAHGSVEVTVHGTHENAFSAAGSRAWVERTIDDASWDEVTVDGRRPRPENIGAALPFDLETGTVPGGGVTLRRRPAKLRDAVEDVPQPVVEIEGATVLRPAVRFRSVLLAHRPAEGAPARRPPLPVAGAADFSTSASRAGEEALVEGVLCSSGHFNDPEVSTCPSCGAAAQGGDSRRVTLPRPPLGILVTDGGSIYTVTGDYVIGREPERAAAVVSGQAQPLLLRDTGRSTSRVHAYLMLSGWKVLISDNGSANGTFVSRNGPAGPWVAVTSEAPMSLAPGDRVRLGKRQLLFDCYREAVIPHASC